MSLTCAYTGRLVEREPVERSVCDPSSSRGVAGAGGLALTYGDAVGDLLLSSTGGLIGSILAVRWLGPAET